jgi:2-deoxy-D-gluconate 3-dehydrogenase
VAEFGAVDILVNNAGVFPMQPLLEATRESFERVLAVNVEAVAFCAQAAAAQMVHQGGGGAIINIASVDGLHPSMEGLAAYDASKAGVIALTKSMALELGRHRIRVNAIAPGGINTEGTMRMRMERGMTREEAETFAQRPPPRLPAGRRGTPDDIGKVAVFLASSAADYVTGETLVVDGGFLLM